MASMTSDKQAIMTLEPVLTKAVNAALNAKTDDPIKFVAYYLQHQKPPPVKVATAEIKTMGLKMPSASLGVVRLDYNYPPAAGDIDSPESFHYDVHYRAVPGLTFATCQSGKMPANVEENFIQAIRHLESKGVSCITGDCGFMMYFQALARQHTKLPVQMSALCQLPSITCAYQEGEMIAIFTANSETLAPMRDLIRDECGVDTQNQRYIIVGCQDVPGFEAVEAGEKVDVAYVTPGMVKKAKDLQAQVPALRAILLECTELPPYADAIRAATGLPVYDAITGCNFFLSGLQDNERFGLNDWCEKWDGVQDNYVLGSELTPAERAEMKTL